MYSTKIMDWSVNMKNNKGFTLLEMLTVIIILGIFIPLIGKFVVNITRVTVRAEKAYKNLASIPKTTPSPAPLPPAVAPGADQRTYLPTQNKCELLKGAFNSTIQWYAKRQATDVVGFYKNSTNCTTGYIGTLTAQSNPTYDDDTTNTFWNVSSAGTTLRVLVRKLNLPD